MNSNKIYNCKFCDFSTENYRKLASHSSINHTPMDKNCIICFRKMPTKRINDKCIYCAEKRERSKNKKIKLCVVCFLKKCTKRGKTCSPTCSAILKKK
jgi:hypothetical protein